MQTFISAAALLIAASAALFVYNVIRSLRSGAPAGDDPWQARTLEWRTASPPPHGNFKQAPRAAEAPYDYGVPA